MLGDHFKETNKSYLDDQKKRQLEELRIYFTYWISFITLPVQIKKKTKPRQNLASEI
jgi:hypothetical protein